MGYLMVALLLFVTVVLFTLQELCDEHERCHTRSVCGNDSTRCQYPGACEKAAHPSRAGSLRVAFLLFCIQQSLLGILRRQQKV
jgi:hypothetical protein